MLHQIEFKNLLKIESKDAATYTLVTFITGLGSFLMVPLFWSKLSPADYGIIAISEIIGGFFGGIAGLSLDQSQTRFYHEWPKDERKQNTGTLWLASWGSTIVIGIIISFLLFALSHYIFPEIDFYPFVFYGLIISVIGSFSSFPFATIRIMQLTKVYAWFRLTGFGIGIGLQIVFILFLDKGVIGYFYASIISGVIMLVMLTFLMINLTKIKFRFADLHEPLVFSLPMIPSTLIGNITGQVDRFLLQHYVDLNTLGIYSVSLRFAGLVNQLHAALKLSYGPFAYKTLIEAKDTGKIILSKMTTFYLFPLFVLVFATSIFIDDFIILTNQQTYKQIIDVVPFLAYITLISCLYIYIAPGIVLSKRTKLLIVPVLGHLIILIVIGLLLLPYFGIFGLLITKFVAGTTFLLVSLIISNRVYDWRPQYGPISMFFIVSILLICLNRILTSDNFIQNLSIDILFLIAFIFWGVVMLKRIIK
jgi:O-antigen/teichoic acid export membrane protein